MLEVCTDKHRLIFPIQCDRRMQALQILNTLCTLLLEKMNTFLLTCLYLSFTLYTHIWPPQAARVLCSEGPPKLILAYSLHSLLIPQLWRLWSDKLWQVLRSSSSTWFSESLSYTLWMDKPSPCSSASSPHRSNRTTDPSTRPTGDLHKVTIREGHTVCFKFICTAYMYVNQIRARNLGNNLKMKKYKMSFKKIEKAPLESI